MYKLTKMVHIDEALIKIEELISQEVKAIILKGHANHEDNFDDLKQIFELYRKHKIEICALDPSIQTYSLFDGENKDDRYRLYEKWLNYADKLKVNYVFLRLPEVVDILEVMEFIKPEVQGYLDLAKQYKKQWVLYPEKHPAHVFSYIIKMFGNKHFKCMFDPINFYKLKESNIAAYRILKDDILFLFAKDSDEKYEPTLLGYGKTKVLEVLKRFVRDKFNGYVVLENQFNEVVLEEKPKKILGFIPFKSKNKKKMLKFAAIIFEDETKKVTESDLLENQIKFIQTIFNNA